MSLRGDEMASLEELLAEEGFQGGRKNSKHRSSFKAISHSMPLYLYPEQNPSVSASNGKRTQRTKSAVHRHGSGIKLNTNEKASVGRSQCEKNPVEASRKDKQVVEIFGEIGSNEIHEDDNINVSTPKHNLRDKERHWTDFHENEIFEEQDWNDLHENQRLSHRLSNVSRTSEISRHVNKLQEDQTQKQRTWKDLQENESRPRSVKHLQEKMRFKNNSRKSLLKCNASSAGDNTRLQNVKIVEDIQRHSHFDQLALEPALDEVAIQAMVSILNGYIRRFLKDEDFRISIRHNCSSCLSFVGLEDHHDADSSILVNLREAIETVERIVEESGSQKELKKASLQLSVVAGLNSKSLIDGLTSGIPNSHLAACAHLYLSVIYKLQKKDRVSAKHLLQVFCDSPYQARANLLPDLWDHLFLPHFSHLRVWYDQEAEAIPNTSSRSRKLKHLEKVYNEILDSGAYQFAVYYKEWLTEGIEAPAIPSIHIPKASARRVSPTASFGPSPDHDPTAIGSIPSQPIISKKLYEAVFGHSNNLNGAVEAKDGKMEDNFNSHSRRSNDTVEVNGTGSQSSKQGSFAGLDVQEYPANSIPEDALVDGEEFKFHSEHEKGSCPVGDPDVKELEEEGHDSHSQSCQNISESTTTQHLFSHTKASELTLKKLAKSVIQLQKTEGSTDPLAALPQLHSECMEVLNLYTNANAPCSKCEFMTPASVSSPAASSSAGLYANLEYFEESSFFSSIPKDFMCPLSGQLFEDPVTLETGQTFERVTIKEWFDRGNKTCPVTQKRLESTAVPVTNFVLKRVIDGRKSEHCRDLLAFATQVAGSSFKHNHGSKDEAALFILEKLLTEFSSEGRMENAKYLISLGGLQFLLRRFELGNLAERARVAALLSCCIKADGGCRNYMARNLKKSCLIELLHDKQVRSRMNAVLLLTELICLNRWATITSFLGDLQGEVIMNTLHVLLVYLQSSPPEQKPLVSVLLLHFDLLVEPRRLSIYREEAVDAIIVALDCSLTDEKVREQTCRALFVLGGHFSSSGEVMIESWLLKQAGYYDGCDTSFPDDDDRVIQIDESMPREEEKDREDWLQNLAVLLLGNGRKSFLQAISKSLSSGNPDLARACLSTVAWLSEALTSMTDTEFQLSAFSTLVPQLKESLEHDQLEFRVLASMSLFNFSKVSECRGLLMTFAEEIMAPLRSLANTTWTAKELLSVISGTAEKFCKQGRVPFCHRDGSIETDGGSLYP